MDPRTLLAAGAIVTSLALPAAAAAGERPSAASVRQQVQAADQSLDKVAAKVNAGQDTQAAAALARQRKHMRSARSQAARLRRAGSAVEAASAYRALGVVSNDCADVLSGVVTQAGAPAQLGVANAIVGCVVMRDQAVQVLTQLMEVVPAAFRPFVARALALLTTDGQDEVTAISQALTTPGLPPAVATALQHALELATTAIDMGIEQLESIAGLVPPVAQPIVQQAIAIATGQLQQVKTLLQGLLGNLLGGGTPGGGAPGTVPGGLIPDLGGLLSGLPFNLVLPGFRP